MLFEIQYLGKKYFDENLKAEYTYKQIQKSNAHMYSLLWKGIHFLKLLRKMTQENNRIESVSPRTCVCLQVFLAVSPQILTFTSASISSVETNTGQPISGLDSPENDGDTAGLLLVG